MQCDLSFYTFGRTHPWSHLELDALRPGLFSPFMTKDLENNISKSSACRLHAHTTIPTNMWHELRECLQAGRFRASLIVHTTCVRSWCNWRTSCVAANNNKKNFHKLACFEIQNHSETIISWTSQGRVLNVTFGDFFPALWIDSIRPRKRFLEIFGGSTVIDRKFGIEMKMFKYWVMNVERGFPSKKYFIIIHSFKNLILPVKLLIVFAIFTTY